MGNVCYNDEGTVAAGRKKCQDGSVFNFYFVESAC